MELAVSFVSEVYQYLGYRDDTPIDRLNRLYTVALLSTFVPLISVQQYVAGSQIVCWTPAEFSGTQAKYAHDICWLGHSNYYVAENLTTLENPSVPRPYPFYLYPWLPVILFAMIASFIAPYLLIWRGLAVKFGISIDRLMKLGTPGELAQAIHFNMFPSPSPKRFGNFIVTCLFLLMKIYYIVNLGVQVLIINKLLFGDYFQINLEQIRRILSVKYNMWSSAHLPIETMCDFMIRMLGQNNNWYTVQCVLPYNLFTKRIFALLNIWFLVLIILNLYDLLFVWLWRRLWSSVTRYNDIFQFFDLYTIHLLSCTDEKPQSKELFGVLGKTEADQVDLHDLNNHLLRHEFVHTYLGVDGYLLIKLLHANSSNVRTTYVIVNLFDRFVQARRPKRQRISARAETTTL